MSDTYYDEATINDLEYIVTIYNDLNKDKWTMKSWNVQ
jgi:hypothetical protein